MITIGSTLGVPHRMWSLEEKLQIVRLHRERNVPTRELHRRFGVNSGLISVWCRQYENYGAERLRPQNGIPRQPLPLKKEQEYTMENNFWMDDTFVNKILGKLICDHRKEAGYSQKELGKKVGLSQQHLSQVEQGNRSFLATHFAKLCVVLDIPPINFRELLTTPTISITPATPDDVSVVMDFDSHLTEGQFLACIRDQQLYILRTPIGEVGVCRFSMFQQYPMLDWLYIAPDYRRKGYGQELLSHWESDMQNVGYDRVMISVSEKEHSRFFFEKRGYLYCGDCALSEQKLLMYRKNFN